MLPRNCRRHYAETLFFAARPFAPSKNASLGPRVPMSTFSKPSEPMLGVLWFEGTQKYKTRTIEPSRSHVARTPAAPHSVHLARAARSMRTRFAHVWDAYSSSRRRQRPIGFPPGVRDVHSAHPLRHATQVAKSSRDRLRRECCLAAPRAREARRRGGVRDRARRRQNRLTRRRRGIVRHRCAAPLQRRRRCV